MAKLLATSPQPDRLYRLQTGDTLLEVAGEAYGVGAGEARLGRAQLVSRHPFNWRFHRSGTSDFVKKFFPEGIVTFTRRFSCADADFNDPAQFTPTGRCLPIAFIPPDTDVWRRSPAEVVQPDARTCWAAAILSWSMVTPRAKQFRSVDHVVETFRELEIEIPARGGTARRRFVTTTGGLVRWPKRDVVFTATTGSSVTVPAGRITLETIAAELGVEFVQRDHRLELKDVLDVLERSAGPVVVLKFKSGTVGHGTVIFGASNQDKFVGEMDPFPISGRPTGPAFGKLGTRWLPTFEAFAEQKGERWEEFVFLFRER